MRLQLHPAEPVSRQQDDQRSDVRAVLGRGRGPRHVRSASTKAPRQRHAASRHRPLRGARRPPHHHPHDGDDAGLPRGDLGRRLREAPEAAHRASSNRAAAGSRRGSTAWTVISTTRAPTTRVSRRGPAKSSSAIAGFRSSRSRAASRCWRITSAPTRSCRRPTTRIRMGSSPARRKWCGSRSRTCHPRRSTAGHGRRRPRLLRAELTRKPLSRDAGEGLTPFRLMRMSQSYIDKSG